MEDDFKGGRCLLSGDAPSNVSTVESAKFSLHLRLPRCPLQAEFDKMTKNHQTDSNHFFNNHPGDSRAKDLDRRRVVAGQPALSLL